MRYAILLLACMVASARAGTTDDAVPDAKYVAYGKEFATHVGRLDVTRSSGIVAGGSCVLVSDRAALTAAHVLTEYRSAVVVTAAGMRKVASIIRHPEYREDVFGRNDLAVVVVDEPFGLESYPALSDGTEKEGDTASIAGFGLTGRLSVGHTHSDGLLRAGHATISRFEDTVLVCPARSPGTPLPLCIAPGDSGGPLFVAGKVAGIASHTSKRYDGTATRSKDGEESCHTRVSLYREWLSANVPAKR